MAWRVVKSRIILITLTTAAIAGDQAIHVHPPSDRRHQADK